MLHHTIVRGTGTAGFRLVVLHGIYGQGRNWASVASALVQLRPDWEVVLVDLREHGRSRGLAPPHDLDATADDVAELVAHTKAAAILGHSFGGKVALAASAGSPPALARAASRRVAEASRGAPGITQVWVADSDPTARDPAGSAWEMLALLKSLPREWESRERFVGTLASQGLEPGVAGWMATNLERIDERAGGGFRFALDLEVMEALLRSYFASDLWPAVEKSAPGRIRVIRAAASPVIGEAAVERFVRAGARVHEVKAGHWLNAEAPGAVAQLLADELPR